MEYLIFYFSHFLRFTQKHPKKGPFWGTNPDFKVFPVEKNAVTLYTVGSGILRPIWIYSV